MSKEVFIDGVRYLPADEVILNKDDFMRILFGMFWGDGPEWKEKYEKYKDSTYVILTDDPVGFYKPDTLADVENIIADSLASEKS